jgi:hypothetical protein
MRLLAGNLGITISRQIDEVTTAQIGGPTSNPIKVDRLRSTRCVTGVSQPLGADQGIDQAGLSDVASP